MTQTKDTCSDTAVLCSETQPTGLISRAASFVTALVGMVESRIERAAFRRLLSVDDRILKDVGVTRGDVYWASELPINVNAGEALRRVSLQARRPASQLCLQHSPKVPSTCK